ncbi:hypothetical protein [Photobacterium sp. 53610]
MSIPTNFGVTVNTPEPVTIKIDISERAMIMTGFVVVAAALVIKKIKG